MKKFLLTLAVGIAMLSLPVIASAAPIPTTMINYSGLTTHVIVHGIEEGKNVLGKKTLKPFFPLTAYAASKANNTVLTTDTSSKSFSLTAWLNSATELALGVDNGNFGVSHGAYQGTSGSNNLIAPWTGRSVLGNGWFTISYNITGDTLANIQNIDIYGKAPHPGYKAQYDYIYGDCILVMSVVPKTGAVVMKTVNPTPEQVVRNKYASYSTLTNGVFYTYSSIYLPYMVNNVNVSPIKLTKRPVWKGYTSVPGNWWN